MNLLQRDPSVMKFWKQKNRHSILKQKFEVHTFYEKKDFTVVCNKRSKRESEDCKLKFY
jgi:hypothetical protein